MFVIDDLGTFIRVVKMLPIVIKMYIRNNENLKREREKFHIILVISSTYL